jgi:hypothetical protein
VRVARLSIEGAGGDGVYIGQRKARQVPEDIVLDDLRIKASYRQGVSVISARGLRIVRCEISDTSGHLPGAGIDFEPSSGLFGFEDCVISSCSIHGIAGPAIYVYLATRSTEGAPSSIEVRDCRLSGFPYAIYAAGLGSGARGALRISGSRLRGLVWKSSGSDFTVERD